MKVMQLKDPATGELVGALVPVSNEDRAEMRRRKVKVGRIVRIDMTLPRNANFNALAHKFGEVIRDNIEAFAGMDPHAALKRLQFEAGVECDERGVLIDAFWPDLVHAVEQMQPGAGYVMRLVGDQLQGKVIALRETRSLAFDSMDEVRFRGVIDAIASWVAAHYWPDCSPVEIERMANIYTNGTA